jgi:hypothetical protein
MINKFLNWKKVSLQLSYFLLPTELKMLEIEKDGIEIEDESTVGEYYQLLQQMKKLKESIRNTINLPIHALPYLQPGE